MKSNGLWVYLIGIGMFIWGFCQMVYALMDINLPIIIPFTEWGNLLGEEELFSDIQLGLAAGCILSGFGMLIFQAWARILAVWLIWAFVVLFFYIFLLIGPLEFENFFIRQFAVSGTIGLLLLWFFNQETTRETLNSDPRKYRWRLIPTFTLLLVCLCYYVYAHLPAQLPLIFENAQFPEVKQASYKPASKNIYKTHYERTIFPLSFTVAVPKGTRLISLNQRAGFEKARQCEIHLDTPKRSHSLFLTNETPIQKEWNSEQTQDFLERINMLTPYAYARKIFTDRRSIIYWKSRNQIGAYGGDEIHSIQYQNLEGFVVQAKKPGELFGRSIRWYYDFNLYMKETSAGGGKLIGFKRGQSISKNILASIQENPRPNKSAQEFFVEGESLRKKRKYEKAKMAFASALCQKGDNPFYHHALAEMFYKTGKYDQADRHLVKALERKEEYPDDWKRFEDIQKLFKKTRKKLGKPAKLKSGQQA